MFGVIMHTFKDEGIGGFFKGIGAPLAARIPVSATMFLGNGVAKRFLNEYDLNVHVKSFLAGCFAGLCNLHMAFFFDLLKTRAQIHTRGRMRYRDEIRFIY
mmetsp:Transcript_5776/g.4384  ORF Transcript_5776/g.4384 Transcript_5776/m.4384 type:complete len:101 (+) Transcript_5776:44-346(+)